MLVCCLPDDDADSPATRFQLTRLTVIHVAMIWRETDKNGGKYAPSMAKNSKCSGKV